MPYFKNIDLNSSERFVFVYENTTQAELEKTIDSSMISLGYKHLGNGTYQKGNKMARFWLGALHKYYKFTVSIDASNPEAIKVGVVNNVMGLYQGGLIGMNDIKSQLEYLKKVFQTI